MELGPAGQARAEGVVPTPPGQSIITVSVTAGSHANGWGAADRNPATRTMRTSTAAIGRSGRGSWVALVAAQSATIAAVVIVDVEQPDGEPSPPLRRPRWSS